MAQSTNGITTGESTEVTPKESGKRRPSGMMRHIPIAVAIISVLFAVLHAIWPNRFDEKTAIFLVIAMAALVLDRVTKLEFFGTKVELRDLIERETRSIRQEVRQVEAGVATKVEMVKDELAYKTDNIRREAKEIEVAVGLIEKRGLREGITGMAMPDVSSKSILELGKDEEALDASEAGSWNKDPNKGQFGGNPKANGRQLEAKITKLAGERSAAANVHIRVFSTDPAKPLTGKVTFYLHPTFGRYAKYSVTAKGGVAEDEITAWGTFTIGVEADGRKTLLELDLMEVPGGSRKFYES